MVIYTKNPYIFFDICYNYIHSERIQNCRKDKKKKKVKKLSQNCITYHKYEKIIQKWEEKVII